MAEEDFQSKCKRFRVHVLKEIYDTEETFTRKIAFVVQDVLYKARERKKLFTDQMLAAVFCNIEDILAHHQSLIASMKTCIGGDGVRYDSLLATCYLKHIDGFDVYSKYGLNHEQAQRALKEILQDQKILAFFSGCMLLGDMGDECRMDSFLVMPIQRICKYPLLMKELLKYTPADHPDFTGVQQCLEKMKGICNATNEAKRRWEKLEEIVEWQSTVEGWEGPDIVESCIEMVLKGQLTKISAGNSQERQIFLLDNSLVYCKKTASHAVPSKRRRSSSISDSTKAESSVVSNLLFRGRIALDNLDIENIEDGTKDYHSHGVTVYHGWKVHNLTKNKWFVLIAKDGKEKQEWIDAIRREKAKRKSRAMGIANSARQMSLFRGEKIYHSMKKEAKSMIKDHKLKLRTHSNCFTGSDLVTWLMMSKEASDEEQAVIIGQGLLENGVIHHVLDKHNFQNNNLLYRFRYDDGTFRIKQESKYLMTGGLRMYLRLVGHHNALVKDLKTTFSSSKNVLSGAKLMDWMIQNEIVQNREEGMSLAKDLFGIKILRHINDEQGFKDTSGVYYRFTPDDGHDGESSSKAKIDLNYRTTFSCANIEVPYTSMEYGFETDLIEQKVKVLGIVEQKLKVASVLDKGHAQARGLCAGQVVVGINGRILSTSEKKHAKSIIKRCLQNSSPISLLIERGSSYICDLVIGKEGLGFHIKSHSPVVIYATDPGLPAARAGVVPGSCILEVNGNKVMKLGHDDVVKEIKKSLSVKSTGLHLRLAQPGLEHVMEYRFESNESQQLLCYEHMLEAPCTFSVPAQLLFLFGTNMTKFAEDINQFRSDDLKVAHFVDELNKVVATTNKHATTLKLHSQSRWPSYKPYGVQSNKLLDGCPTNCHTHVLTVTTTDDGSDLTEFMEVSQNGTMENGWESELQDCTRYVFTTMAAPSLFTGSQKLSEEELVQLQTVKEQLARLVQVTEELLADEEYIKKLVNDSPVYSGNKNQLGVDPEEVGRTVKHLMISKKSLVPVPQY